MIFRKVLRTVPVGTVFSGYGRILYRRKMGGVSFWTVRFREDNVQLMLTDCDTAAYQNIKSLPIGTLVYLEGTKCVTTKGEHSLLAVVVQVVHRFGQSWPDRHHKLSQSARYENRAMDMLVTPGTLEMIRGVSVALSSIRSTLVGAGFHECNTGVLQKKFEAGAARPFITEVNATKEPCFLSLTAELKLKRLVAGGLERVYEIAQSFRNEGIDHMHAPEFTLLEAYGVGYDCFSMMKLIENMVQQVFEAVADDREGTGIPVNSNSLVVQAPFRVVTFGEAFSEYVGDMPCTLDAMVKYDPSSFHMNMGTFTWLMKVIEKIIVPRVSAPTFLTRLPADMSPLTKKLSDGTTDRAFFLMDRLFIADIYTDENDEQLVSEALAKQAQAQGTDVNQDFVEILSMGIPPTAGIGMGLNRLFMALLGGLPRHIKETVLFSPF